MEDTAVQTVFSALRAGKITVMRSMVTTAIHRRRR
jgi:hypothetical protein